MADPAERIERANADEFSLDRGLESRIAAMRRLLDAMAPASTAAALTALRDAFPEVPLAQRVRAMTARRH